MLDGLMCAMCRRKSCAQPLAMCRRRACCFSGSIASNLRYGDEAASDEALRTACDVAQATEFVSELPEGLDTYVSQGGTSVSGGQRQRLSIARALVKKGAGVYL